MLSSKSAAALLILSAVLLALIATQSNATTLSYTLDIPAPHADAGFGTSVALGDATGDGKADVLVGAAFEDVGGNVNQGRAYLFDGAAGALLRSFDTPNGEGFGRFGFAVALGDTSGDGRSEVVIGAFNETVGGSGAHGRAYIFDAGSGSLIHTLSPAPTGQPLSFGQRLAVGDVDGDSFADVVAAAPDEGGSVGGVYAYSGVSGTPIHHVTSPNPQGGSYFGIGVAAGDVDGDGRSDIIAGAFREDVGANPDQGRVYIYSGLTGALTRTVDVPTPQDFAQFGASISAGDIDGDLATDYAIAGNLEDVGGNAFQGRVHLFSGASGNLLRSVDHPEPQGSSFFGTNRLGDLDGDGLSELMASAQQDIAPHGDQGRAYAISADDGSLIDQFDTPNPQTSAVFGRDFALGDINGDGLDDAAIGAPLEDVSGNVKQGRVYLFLSPSTPLPTPCSGCPVGGRVDLTTAPARDAHPNPGWSEIGVMVGVFVLGGMSLLILSLRSISSRSLATRPTDLAARCPRKPAKHFSLLDKLPQRPSTAAPRLHR